MNKEQKQKLVETLSWFKEKFLEDEISRQKLVLEYEKMIIELAIEILEDDLKDDSKPLGRKI